MIVALAYAAALAAASTAQSSAKAPAAVPALLAASAVVISRSAPWPASTCVLEHGPHAPPQTVGGLVARQLAEFTGGRNTVRGVCGPGPAHACKVSVDHADGEDVSATTISFRLKDGRLDAASLLCDVTP